MDYVVGSVAALISGNVTPNRPKLIRRALTPTKHQPSPNVTPKSEFVDDRSIFLSPTMQKKKAIVKKSPKRIFQNPEVDVADEEGNTTASSPKADKVKKHLKEDLESSDVAIKVAMSPKSPKKKLNKSSEDVSHGEKPSLPEDMQRSNENTPRKKKKGTISNAEGNENVEPKVTQDTETTPKGPENKKKLKKNNPQTTIQDNDKQSPNKKTEEVKQDESTNMEVDQPEVASINNKKKRRKKNKKNKPATEVKPGNTESQQTNNNKKGKNKKNKQVKNQDNINPNTITTEDTDSENDSEVKPTEITESQQTNNNMKDKNKKLKQAKTRETVNPNAITTEDTDSEHDSDDEIESENEEINKEILDTPAAEDSSDEDDAASKPSKPMETKEIVPNVSTEEELKRTLFIGNVPFSSKCKKEIKKIFGKHGQIETIRIRTVPVKDARVTPKLAVIKEELHPERSTVNVYIKYKDSDSIYKALIENNTVLNDHHLRVSRSDTTGAEHDPNCSVFVGNLPFALEDETFRATFEKCGEIDSVRIIRDKKTNAGKGFGYINFTSKDGVELALALTEEDLTIKNRILRVKRCTLTNKQGGSNQRGMGMKRGFGNRGGGQRGGIQSERGGFQSQRGFNSHRGGNFQRGGSFQRGGNSQRGGSFQRGGNSQRGGSFQRGGNSQRGGSFQRGGNFQRGGFNNRRGGFNRGDTNNFEHNKEQNDNEGALRRIKNKRPNMDGGEGPPNKKEKKTRQEFVGMTAEKKKKTKFDKGQKKKKLLSEILTK